MKTAFKISLLGLVAAVAMGMSSFTTKKEKDKIHMAADVNGVPISGAAISDELSRESELSNENEWSQVYNFIDEKICTALAENDQENGKKVKMNYFSRCPSGYQSVIASKDEAVKCGNYVYGRINFYSGCSPKYICNFKVNVDKGLAMVKTKEMTNYVPISDWLNKKTLTKAVVKG